MPQVSGIFSAKCRLLLCPECRIPWEPNSGKDGKHHFHRNQNIQIDKGLTIEALKIVTE